MDRPRPEPAARVLPRAKRLRTAASSSSLMRGAPLRIRTLPAPVMWMSTGASARDGLHAQKFDLLTRAQGQEFTSNITYANGSVETFKVDPPIMDNIDRVAIERRHLTAATDMMAPFVLRGPALDKSLCSKQMPIFTGVERFNLTMKYVKDDTATSKRTGYQGPLVLCSMHYTPISGHYTTNEITTYLARNERILVWYAPLKTPGYYIPYRALITTEAGDLSVVLTDLSE